VSSLEDRIRTAAALVAADVGKQPQELWFATIEDAQAYAKALGIDWGKHFVAAGPEKL
jgi:hypothetical protein